MGFLKFCLKYPSKFIHHLLSDSMKAIQGEIKISTENGETRTLRSAPDWGETAINGDHLWVSTSTSGDLCYVGENECSKQGPRLCCPACKITAHTGCIGILIDKIKFHCKPTFKDVGVRQYREQTVIHHHWVHRRSQKGRCRQCGKSFQSKLSFANKEIVAISCSWCKTAYHNKENCFTLERLTETCSLGIHKDLIIPHSWIVKLPRKGSFKSSIRRSPKNKRSSSKRRTKKEDASPIVAVSSENSHHLPVHPLSSSSSSCSPQPPPIHPTVGLTSTMPPQSSSAPQPLTPLSANQLPSCSFSSSAVLSQSQPNNSNPMDISSSSSLATSSTITATSSTAISSLGAGPQPNVPTPPPPGAVPTEPRPSLCAPGQHRSFAIKPIPSPDSKPLLVFINPKSGGNQGSKLMQKFQWLLNPRQVFDLSQGGPRPGLELYRKVPNLRILACGGDGTAGWILSVLDEIGFKPSPPIAVLPLGTGNDLARALGWGGGYTDEPVSKILLNIKDGEVVQLDRWDVKVTRNTDLNLIEQAADTPEGAKESLPLNVINNYFSIGVDAHIALEFHEAREAHPERFNSRLRNKMFYGQAGGKDLLQRKWKDLVTYITVECDGVDLTQRLRDLKVHSLLFLNIPCYGGGTRPWGSASPSFELPRTDDGLIEVIGLTTYQLPLLQAGGHGSCVAQCKEAKIITRRTIPMQVDGEPCRLLPSIIRIKVKNQANMVAKSKTHCQIASMPTLDREIVIPVRKLNILDYETFHYDKSRLHDASIVLGKLQINPDLELNHVRALIRQMVANHRKGSTSINMLNKEPGDEMARYRLEKAFDISNDWCFVDSCTAERYFRIDRAQEHLHYVVDICNDELYILDPTDNGYDRDKLAKASNVPTTQLADNSPASGLSGDETPSPVDPALYGDNNNTIVLFKPPTTKEPGSGKDDSGDTLNVNTASQLLEASSIPGTPTTATETLTETATESNNPSASKETVMSDKGKNLSNYNVRPNNEMNVDEMIYQRLVYSTDERRDIEPNLVDFKAEETSNELFRFNRDERNQSDSYLHKTGDNSNDNKSDANNTVNEAISSFKLNKTACDCVSLTRSEAVRVNVTGPDNISIDYNSNEIIEAVKRADLTSLKRLREQGYNLSAVDSNGLTTLHYAAMLGYHDIIQYLVDLQPDLINYKTYNDGQTPLHYAILYGQRISCFILAAAGSSVTDADAYSHNAKDLAIMKGDHELAAYLDPMHENFTAQIIGLR